MAKVRITLSEIATKLAEKREWAVERKARHASRGNAVGIQHIEKMEADWDALEAMVKAINEGKRVNHYDLKVAVSSVVTFEDVMDIEII